jgi:hypothetical protein
MRQKYFEGHAAINLNVMCAVDGPHLADADESINMMRAQRPRKSRGISGSQKPSQKQLSNPAKPLIFSRRIGSFFDQPDFRDLAATSRAATAPELDTSLNSNRHPPWPPAG